jgi:hypothetical protein
MAAQSGVRIAIIDGTNLVVRAVGVVVLAFATDTVVRCALIPVITVSMDLTVDRPVRPGPVEAAHSPEAADRHGRGTPVVANQGLVDAGSQRVYSEGTAFHAALELGISRAEVAEGAIEVIVAVVLAALNRDILAPFRLGVAGSLDAYICRRAVHRLVEALPVFIVAGVDGTGVAVVADAHGLIPVGVELHERRIAQARAARKPRRVGAFSSHQITAVQGAVVPVIAVGNGVGAAPHPGPATRHGKVAVPIGAAIPNDHIPCLNLRRRPAETGVRVVGLDGNTAWESGACHQTVLRLDARVAPGIQRCVYTADDGVAGIRGTAVPVITVSGYRLALAASGLIAGIYRAGIAVVALTVSSTLGTWHSLVHTALTLDTGLGSTGAVIIAVHGFIDATSRVRVAVVGGTRETIVADGHDVDTGTGQGIAVVARRAGVAVVTVLGLLGTLTSARIAPVRGAGILNGRNTLLGVISATHDGITGIRGTEVPVIAIDGSVDAASVHTGVRRTSAVVVTVQGRVHALSGGRLTEVHSAWVTVAAVLRVVSADPGHRVADIHRARIAVIALDGHVLASVARRVCAVTGIHGAQVHIVAVPLRVLASIASGNGTIGEAVVMGAGVAIAAGHHHETAVPVVGIAGIHGAGDPVVADHGLM